MCKFLVRRINDGRRQIGDPVVCKPSSFNGWGRKERHGGNFYIIDIPEMSVEVGRGFLTPEEDPEGRILRRHRFNFLTSQMPYRNRQELLDRSETSINWLSARSRLYDRKLRRDQSNLGTTVISARARLIDG